MSAAKKNKSAARLEKAIRKAEIEKEKNVKFALSVPDSNRVVRLSWTPDLRKTPRVALDVNDYQKVAFSWCISEADILGEWSWREPRNWSNEEFENEIKSHFRSLSGNTWLQIENQSYNGSGGYRKRLNKYQPIESLCPEAQERWNSELDLSEFDQVFRFRTGTNKRIWGIRNNHHFFTIWFERFHKICPVDND